MFPAATLRLFYVDQNVVIESKSDYTIRQCVWVSIFRLKISYLQQADQMVKSGSQQMVYKHHSTARQAVNKKYRQ